MSGEAVSREQRRNARKILGTEATEVFIRVEKQHAQLEQRIKMCGQQLHAEIEERKRSGAGRDQELERLRRELTVLRDDIVIPLGKKVLALERELVSVGGMAQRGISDVNELARYGATLTLLERLAWLVTGRLPRQRADAGVQLPAGLAEQLRTGSWEVDPDVPNRQ